MLKRSFSPESDSETSKFLLLLDVDANCSLALAAVLKLAMVDVCGKAYTPWPRGRPSPVARFNFGYVPVRSLMGGEESRSRSPVVSALFRSRSAEALYKPPGQKNLAHPTRPKSAQSRKKDLKRGISAPRRCKGKRQYTP